MIPAPLLSAEEVAEILGVTPRVVLDMSRARKLASIKVGRCRRFAPADIEAYIAAHRTAPPEPTYWGVRSKGKSA